MDGFDNEDNEYEEAEAEEVDVEDGDAGEEELSHQQKSDAADQLKLIRQHPEIWIPYKEQVQAKLSIKTPAPASAPATATATAAADVLIEVATPGMLRDLSRIDPDHRTYPFLTQYETTKCISFRASQLAHGAQPYIFVPEGMTDSYEIARAELVEKKLPYIIKRPLPDGDYEVWSLADLVVFTTA